MLPSVPDFKKKRIPGHGVSDLRCYTLARIPKLEQSPAKLLRTQVDVETEDTSVGRIVVPVDVLFR